MRIIVLAALHMVLHGSQCRQAFLPAMFRGQPLSAITQATLRSQYGVPLKVFDLRHGESGEVHLVYEDVGEFAGSYVFVFERTKIQYLEVRPRKLTNTEFRKYAGTRLRDCRYGVDRCLSDGESYPLYDDENGETHIYQIPERGLSVEFGPVFVTRMFFNIKPVGEPRSRCKGK